MNFEKWKKELTNHLQENISYEEFEKAVKAYKDLSFELERILENAWRISKGDDREKFRRLYEDFSKNNIGNMYEKLRKVGRGLSKSEKYKNVVEAFESQAYRLMEKTRLALRSEVEYMILRIFAANKKRMPQVLAKAFNPIYPDEVFKVFIYSFLSGILPKEKGGEEG